MDVPDVTEWILTFVLLQKKPDMCCQCSKEKLIFPSLEGFQAAIDFPSVHMVFYEYFLKSCVGDSEWKDICFNPDENDSEAMVNPQLEAFASIMLENNYFPWLLNAKEEYAETLVTDYDTTDVRNTMKTYFADHYMNGVELDFMEIPPGQQFNPENSQDTIRQLMIHDGEGNTKQLFDVLKQQRIDKQKQICLDALMNEKYTAMIVELSRLKAAEPSDEDSDDTPATEAARKERRNSLKKLRKYTNTNKDSNDSYKGWSIETPTDQTKKIQYLEENEDRYVQFRAVYRLMFRTRMEKSAVKKRKPAQQSPVVDFSLLYAKPKVKRRAAL